MKEFFLVWEPKSGYTKHRHDTFESAKKEAERLAKENPTKEFHVLTTLGSCRVKDVEWNLVDCQDEEPEEDDKYLKTINARDIANYWVNVVSCNKCSFFSECLDKRRWGRGTCQEFVERKIEDMKY